MDNGSAGNDDDDNDDGLLFNVSVPNTSEIDGGQRTERHAYGKKVKRKSWSHKKAMLKVCFWFLTTVRYNNRSSSTCVLISNTSRGVFYLLGKFPKFLALVLLKRYTD